MADTDTRTPKSPGSVSSASDFDERSPEAQKQDKALAIRLASIIEDANEKVVPLAKMIRSVCSTFSFVELLEALSLGIEYREHVSSQRRGS